MIQKILGEQHGSLQSMCLLDGASSKNLHIAWSCYVNKNHESRQIYHFIICDNLLSKISTHIFLHPNLCSNCDVFWTQSPTSAFKVTCRICKIYISCNFYVRQGRRYLKKMLQLGKAHMKMPIKAVNNWEHLQLGHTWNFAAIVSKSHINFYVTTFFLNIASWSNSTIFWQPKITLFWPWH